MGSLDEQHQELSTGNRESTGNIRLEYYDRSNEDKSLPFFGKDDTIREILGTTPHLSASLEDIKDFYERNSDSDARTEYIKSIFNNDYTELTLDDGRTVGYKTFQNVLHLWKGHYDSRTAQSFYDWSVIAQHFEAMRLLGELNDRMKPLPSADGQMSFILDSRAEGNKTSAFTFSQEIIDAVLTRGSGISEGKMRIYEQFQKSLSSKENADFLKNEYGWGGSYPVIIGAGIDENHDGKGITLSKGFGNDVPKLTLKWTQVEKRIGELICADRYLNPKEKEQYPQWLEKQEARRAEIEEQKRNREILSTAPLEETEQTNDDDIIGKEVVIDDRRFVIESVGKISGDVSMRDVTFEDSVGFPINRVEKIDYVRSLLAEQTQEQQLPDTRYEYHLGDTVYIGASEYEILSFDDERVMLYDTEMPLFNKEFSRGEFDRKVQENPLNDHLRATSLPAEEKAVAKENISENSTETEQNFAPNTSYNDAFFLDDESQTVTWMYYNPDSNSGGQYVTNTLSYDDVIEAARQYEGAGDFFDYLGSIANQTLADVGTEWFEEADNAFKQTPDLTGCTSATMEALLENAERSDMV
ncbi:MAG: helicase, partial [Acutalibacteraceae bacterium]|nr:helicase [Acutalibacteraceae bacterium]